MTGFARYLPWFAVGLAALYLVASATAPDDPKAGFHYQEFGKISVVEGGRVKPLDTVARNTMMVISNRQTFKDQNDTSQPAIKWLMDVMISNRLFNKDI